MVPDQPATAVEPWRIPPHRNGNMPLVAVSQKTPRAVSFVPVVPKTIPTEIRERVIVLLREGAGATDVVRAVAVEFDGYKVSVPWVTGVADDNGIKLQRGRPVGAKDSTKREPRPDLDVEVRALAKKLHRKHKSLRKVAQLLGRSHERVRQLISDGKEE